MSSPSTNESHLLAFLERSYGPLWPDIRRELIAVAKFQSLQAGQTLLRQGDPPGDAYIVTSGRLRVTIRAEDGAEEVINEVGRGEIIGEMALLTDEPRSATLFAVRDSILARFPRDSFLRLLEHHPRFATSLTRTIIERLRRQSSGPRSDVAPVSTIALVPIDPGVPIAEFTTGFCDALQQLGSVRMLGSRQVDEALNEEGIARIAMGESGSLRLAVWLQDCEESYTYVVYRADAMWSPWTERCTRQADVVLFVGLGGGSAEAREVEARLTHHWQQGRAPRRNLVLLHEKDRPDGTAEWLANRRVEQHFHIRRGAKEDYARLARCAAGKAVALVLGGGSARGLAHIGVLRAFKELGIPIDFIGGTSSGAVLGGMYARMGDWEKMVEEWLARGRGFLDFTWPRVSLLNGAKLNDNLRVVAGTDRIEDLWLPFFAVSTNLTRAEQYVHREGFLFDAVRSSVSLPGVFPPCQRDGDYLVDGGLLNNVPADVMRRIAGPGPLIAVDVALTRELKSDPRISTETSGWGLLVNQLNPFAGKFQGPGIIGLWQRSTEVGCIQERNAKRKLADLYLELSVDDVGMLEFTDVDAISARGYERSIDRIRSWHEEYRARSS